jgi:uncharacterized protein (DUF58 family)
MRLLQYWDRTSFYLTGKTFYALLGIALLFAFSYFADPLFVLAQALLLLFLMAVGADTFLLYRQREGMEAARSLKPRLSNGDENEVTITLYNRYEFPVHFILIDELPLQFQERTWKRLGKVEAAGTAVVRYFLRPTERGAYFFGNINLQAEGPLRLVRRRFVFEAESEVKVYPSFIQLRQHQLQAVSARQKEAGARRQRKLGQSMEFEQIKEYVRGDDYRTINWKATARRGDLMVNNFTDERSQQVYCLINKGRVMKMPFEGMTLLDYAINASLVLSGIALQRQDRAGLITFARNLDAFLPADKKPTQLNQLMETLYRQETDFMEPDFEKVFSAVRNRISHRSLLVLFTNFESIESLQRELPVLKRLAHYHLLMVVFFENTELKALTESRNQTIEDVYIKTIAEKYRHEKRLIARELQAQGIIAVLTTPAQLSANTINKYLELKNRHLL